MNPNSVFPQWRKLSITSKFSAAFVLLLALILVVAVAGYIALTVVRNQTEQSILTSTQVRHLVLKMDTGLQRARTLQRDFFLRYPEIGLVEARRTYAQPAVRQIAEVVGLNNELQAFISQAEVSEALKESEVNLNLYRATTERYGDIFLQTVELVSALAADETGLRDQLDQQSGALLAIIQMANDPPLLSLYREMQSFEKEYQEIHQRTMMQSAFNVAFELEQAIESASTLDTERKTEALAHLQAYQSTARSIVELDLEIRSRFNDFDLQAQSIDPISSRLIALAEAEVERGQTRIEQTNRLATIILALSALIGTLLVIAVANLLNKSVTQNITKLTRTVGQLQAGNLEVRAQVDSADELGLLADAFNDMTTRLRDLISGLEQEIAERKQVEQALRDSEERYRSLFEGVPIGLYRTTPDGQIVNANRALVQMLAAPNRGTLLATDAADFYVDPEDRQQWQDSIERQGVMHDFEMQFRRQDGTTIWVRNNSRIVRDEQGRTLYYEGSLQDITERKQAREAMSHYAERLEGLQQIGLELTSQLDLDTLLRSIVSRAAELVKGTSGGLYLYRPEQKVLELAMVVGVDQAIVGRTLHPGEGLAGRVWQTGEPLIVDDYQRWVGRVAQFDDVKSRTVLGAPIRWGAQRLGVLVTWTDVPNTFSSSDIQLLSLFATQAAIAIENARLFEQAHSHSRELALLNRVIAASVASQEVASILEAVCRELALTFDLPQSAAALFNEEKTKAVVVAEYRAEGRPSALGEVIPASNNPATQYLLEHKSPLVIIDAQTDPRQAPIHDLMHRRGTASLLLLPLIVEEEVVGTLGVDAIERRHFTAGEVALAQRVAEQVSGAIARARLQETQRRLSAAVEQTAEAVVITDLNGKILYVNPAFERISGFSRDQAIGFDRSTAKAMGIEVGLYHKILQAVTAGPDWQGRVTDYRPNGTPFTVATLVTPVRTPSGEIVNYVATMRDVTHEEQLEKQLQQSRKMEALGRLAGGIAHDFNNLLTVIQLNTHLMKRWLRTEDPLWKHVQQVDATGKRAAQLTKQLLSFSRREIIEPQVLNLNDVVGDLEPMLQRIIGEGIEMKTTLEANLWPVKVDPSQMEQVIVNLVVNARDAMMTGGVLTMQTANVILDEDYIVLHVDARPGEYARLSVSDTGRGMSEEVMAHLFEPFFTTKERGQGTGLGLATIFGIVKQNSGHIQVYSEVEQGTTFEIYLPCATEDLDRDQVQKYAGLEYRPPIADELAAGTETILLVEDDAALRNGAEQVLKSCGYQVLSAADGDEALKLSQQHSATIHLLLTDVVMPQMTGPELAERLQTQRPEIQVLYMSGYTDNMIAHHGVLDESVSFLSKPFTLEGLSYKVRSVLDQRI